MSSVRHTFLQHPTSIRYGESTVWYFDTTPWGVGAGAPLVVSAVRLDTGADITGTIFPSGSPTIDGSGIFTLPEATGFTIGVTVRITAQFDVGGQTRRPYMDVSVVP